MFEAEGTSAYIETIFNGLIPCKVLGWANDRELTVKVTRTTRAYKAGEILTERWYYVPPKTCIRRRKYNTFVAPFRYKNENDSLSQCPNG